MDIKRNPSLNSFYTQNNRPLYLTIISVLLVQLALAFQGFDVCDDGFAATFYQQFFNDADSVEYNFVYWLSGLVGGIWYQLFPSGGVLWLKCLALVVNTSTMYLSYLLLKPYIKQSFLLAALVITLFINDFGFLLFYNNHLTAFLAVLSMLFLQKGLTQSNNRYLFLSGLIIGFNVFSRLPNLSQFALILAFPVWYGLKDGGFKAMIKPISTFKFGFFSAFGVVVLVLMILEQFEIMKRAIFSLWDLGSTEQSTHNVGDLLGDYVGHFKKVLKYFILLIFPITIIWFMQKRLGRSKVYKVVLYLFVFIFLVFWFLKTGIFGFYALGYAGLLATLGLTKTKSLRLIVLMGFVMQFFLPFGSGGGIRSIGYASLWLSLPLFFYAIQLVFERFTTSKDSLTLQQEIKISEARIYVILLIVSFSMVRLYNWSNQAYFDPGSRLEKVYSINSEFAHGVFTTKERADVINELLAELPKYIEPNDYLFIYDKSPMIHFLTETRPYMYNSWPWIYDEVSFEKKLNMAKSNREIRPVVVIQKFETIEQFSRPQPDYLSSNIEQTFFHNNKVASVMNTFLKEYSYLKSWSNDYFEIYIPSSHN